MSLQSLGKVLHTFSNRFLLQGSSDPLQCICQQRKLFWVYGMVFVAIASSKDVG